MGSKIRKVPDVPTVPKVPISFSTATSFLEKTIWSVNDWNFGISPRSFRACWRSQSIDDFCRCQQIAIHEMRYSSSLGLGISLKALFPRSFRRAKAALKPRAR
jgi:hypothetical protein